MRPLLAEILVRRGDFTLDLAVELEPGTVTAVLGPNGAGKSTLLRALSGLEPIDGGSISIDGRIVDSSGTTFVPPQERSVGVVFQDYALFPHLTVLERLGVADLAGRRPGSISGGQAQRVALARALATDPHVLLLDEPLAALDIETRESVRVELDARLSEFEGYVVIVTHDPLDAMLLADRVIVLESGRIVQDGSPAALARHPATPYVAALMGVTLVRGDVQGGVLTVDGGGVLHVADTSLSGPVLAVLRPESISLHRAQPEGSARNMWRGVITSLQPSHDRVRVLVDAQPSVIATVTPGSIAELGLSKGSPVWLSLKAVDIDAYATASH